MENEIHKSFFVIEQVTILFNNEVLKFLENIFTKEQNIPHELIPIDYEEQKWWCIKNNAKIVGVVAVWKTESQWHLGRLATDKKLRGLGLGTKLIKKAIHDLFKTETETIVIHARDIVVEMLLKLGAKKTGKRDFFYNIPITPLILCKQDFRQQTQNKL